MEQDEQHLRILAILHYVYAGLTALGALFGGGMMAFIGFTIFSLPTPPQKPSEPPLAAIGWFYIVFGSVVLLIGLPISVLIAIVGRFLARQRYWLFCMIIAGLICVNVPLGTLLGVFTIIVLVRPTVKELFASVQAKPVELPPEAPYHRPNDPSFQQGGPNL